MDIKMEDSPVKKLEKAAIEGTTSQEKAAAMVDLARIHGEGREGVQLNQLAALEWAEKAAALDSRDGYNEIAKILGSACIAEPQDRFKLDYAVNAMAACDLATIRRLNAPEIAENVGTICEYMSDHCNGLRLQKSQWQFDAKAYSYYTLAKGLCVPHSEQYKRIDAALERTCLRINNPLRFPKGKQMYPQAYSFH
jgi:TPR repeat protein